jgi:hypothetical protein
MTSVTLPQYEQTSRVRLNVARSASSAVSRATVLLSRPRDVPRQVLQYAFGAELTKKLAIRLGMALTVPLPTTRQPFYALMADGPEAGPVDDEPGSDDVPF